MEPIYRNQFTTAITDCDCFGRLKPSALVAMLQQVSANQCKGLKLGWEDLAKKNLFWAVIRQKVLITRLPMQGETIHIETWPGNPSRVAYPRSTIGYDANGCELFRAISLWVLMDLTTRAMILPDDSGITVEGYVRGDELTLPRSLAVRHLGGHTSRQVMYSELDLNGHMNNARYLDWATDLLPSAFHKEHPLKGFTINYFSEALESEQIDLQYELTNDGQLLIEAHRPDTEISTAHHRVFAIQAQYV